MKLLSYHITKPTIFMMTSFNASKKTLSGSPLGPSLPRTSPKTMEKTTIPRTFMPPLGSTLVPFGTVFDADWRIRVTVVKLWVPLLNVSIVLFGVLTLASTVWLKVSVLAATEVYTVLFYSSTNSTTVQTDCS